MNNTLFQVKSYLTYWLDAVDEHSLHSPFFFNFYTRILNVRSYPPKYKEIEDLRKKLLSGNKYIVVSDLGSGSKHVKGNRRMVSEIARTSLSAARYSSAYWRIIDHFNFQSIVELGTSLGINTLFLSSSPTTSVLTFEGSEEIAGTAEELFSEIGATNIKVLKGDIEITLPIQISSIEKVDFAFMDANHKYEPTIKYFNLLSTRTHTGSIIVLDDIHSSAEMERAWRKIQRHDQVHATADLYRCGLVFFDPSLNKQHVVLRF